MVVVWFEMCAVVTSFIFECGDVEVPRCDGVKCDVKCGAMWNVAISDMVRCECLKCKMCDVEYHVSLYVECCIMQDVESYVMRNVVAWNCGGEECRAVRVLCGQMWWCDVKSRCGVM